MAKQASASKRPKSGRSERPKVAPIVLQSGGSGLVMRGELTINGKKRDVADLLANGPLSMTSFNARRR